MSETSPQDNNHPNTLSDSIHDPENSETHDQQTGNQETSKTKQPLFNPSEEEPAHKNLEKDIPDADLLKMILEPETIDQDIQITIGHITTEDNTAIQISAYPKTLTLDLFSVNPLLDLSGPSFVPTAYLPYDLQLWWNINHKVHATEEDKTHWAMVTVMDDSRKLCNLEVIKSTLESLVTHFLPVIGPGENSHSSDSDHQASNYHSTRAPLLP